ncbi:tubulin polyglutamylase TTLL5 isoform X3 [Hemiscyllium ocellatum]|uniref:tubulin polyglutamylase TTLL5 isoform X3 n=1 Tax=Hemiscyllium ocellatum TaxID=170820 RepID=UPI002966394D|nr:tubulin polyglutamylase TTLL5 isoform X3 [Hemiscyllium ocellatum]
MGMPAVSHVPENSSTASDEEEHEDHPCILWTGINRLVPTLVFYADGIVTKDSTLRLIGERYHLAYKIVRTESRLVRSILTVHGFHEVHPNSNDFNLMWTGSHLKPYVLRSLLEFQKVNHFPRSYELTRKDRLYKNIQRMQQTFGFRHFNIVPQAYILPAEYQELWTAHTKDKGAWIVKPVASSRGRGVYLVTNPNQITTDESILVSRYIRSPLLIDDFKFDVRLYVLVTSYDPLVVYLYEEGLTRFATVKYDRATKNIKNQFMHLTNYSINKKSQDYVSCDDPDVEDYGNKWSMSAMLRYLKQEGMDTVALMAQIEDLIIKALIAAELHIASASKMFVPHRGNCFELYGFDVLIDSNLKPWLLEVNLSPSLAWQFLEHKTTLNYVLATRLFAGRKKKLATSLKLRNGVTQSNHGPVRTEVLLVEAHNHVQQYERKLLSLEERRKQNQHAAQTALGKGSSHKIAVASSGSAGCEAEGEGEEEAEDDEEISEDEAENSDHTCPVQALAQEPISKDLRVNNEGMQEQLELTEREVVGKQMLGQGQSLTQTKEEENSKQPKVNLLEMIQQGANLSKVQARLAFASYLQRVQFRLLRERLHQSEPTTLTDQEEEQMDLVIRFLKRAASNLQQSVMVTLPSRRLPISERRHMLAQQLGVFIRSYNKETDRIIKRSQMDPKPETCIQQEEFQVFVSKASENDLEELLTTYTRKNKSASVFLGTQTRNGNQSIGMQQNSTKSTKGPAVLNERNSCKSDGSGDGRFCCTENHSMQDVSSYHVHPPHTALQQAGYQPMPTSLPTCATPTQDLATSLAEVVGRTGTGASRLGSATLPSRHPLHPGTIQRPTSSTLPITPVSSFQAATQIYSRKISRPTSATAGSGVRCLSRLPQSAAMVGTLGEGDHQPTPSEDVNHEAISIILQRLAAKQRARQYSASNHLNILTQQLSNMNLASGAMSRGNMFTTPGFQSSVKNLDSIHAAHLDSQAPSSGCGDRIASTASRGFVDNLSWDQEVECAYNTVTGVTPRQRYQPTSGSQQLQYALQHLQQQQQHSRQLLDTSRARQQVKEWAEHNRHQGNKQLGQSAKPGGEAILTENQSQAVEPSLQWSAALAAGGQTSVSSKVCTQWPVSQQKLEGSESGPPLLPPRPPPSTKQGSTRKAFTQRVSSSAKPSRLSINLTSRPPSEPRSEWTS